jgi:hypothetical protein
VAVQLGTVVDRAISGPLERGMAPRPRPYSALLARHRLVRHALQGPEHYLIRSGSELGHLVRLRSGESTACRAPGVCAGAASDARVRFRDSRSDYVGRDTFPRRSCSSCRMAVLTVAPSPGAAPMAPKFEARLPAGRLTLTELQWPLRRAPAPAPNDGPL